ncbi:MAG TPA: hypothetical protein VFW73_02335 [Lacipirellulaceae bacterium]|nr:hypothetical protein [Lacipirellulaceae bacterium]
MPIQLECPGCKTTLQVPDEMAGKQGKCIHCGQRLTVPGKASASVSSIGSVAPSLFEANPESMVRELHRRQQSALLLIFTPSKDGGYDLANMPDADLKCIATEDINQARFAQVVEGFAKRFGPRRRIQAGSSSTTLDEQLYELKGDRLGMTLEEFRGKYNRSGDGGQRLPLCSDTAWGANKASLHSEPWHRAAGIIHARIDLPTEDNSPTIAGVKTDLLLYHFIDGKLFRISAYLPTDQFHVVSEAAIKKYGPVTRETHKPRQLIWENPWASVILTRGSVHPREASVLELIHKQLDALATSRAPTAAADI